MPDKNLAKSLVRKQVKEDIHTAKLLANDGDYLEASFRIAKSLNVLGNLGDKALLKEAKALSVAYNKEAEKLLTTHEIIPDIDPKIIDGLEDYVVQLTKSSVLKKNLERMTASRLLVPRYDEAVKNAKKIVPLTAQLVTHITYGDNGYLKSFDNFSSDWLFEHYNIQLNLSMSMINMAFSRLYRNNQFDTKPLMDVISGRGMYGLDQLLRIRTILDHRFSGDYYSAICLLVPLLDKTFMSLSGVLGIDTYTFGNKLTSTRGKTLSSPMLNSKECQKVWGKDFCIMLDMFLFNEDGYKYRHRVAHGELALPEYSYTYFNLIFYFLIKISFMVKATKKK